MKSRNASGCSRTKTNLRGIAPAAEEFFSYRQHQQQHHKGFDGICYILFPFFSCLTGWGGVGGNDSWILYWVETLQLCLRFRLKIRRTKDIFIGIIIINVPEAIRASIKTIGDRQTLWNYM
jgi:hypothetical protein